MDQSVPFWDFVDALEHQGARPHGGPERRRAGGRGRGGFGRRGGFGGWMGLRHLAGQEEQTTTQTDDELTSDDETPVMTTGSAIIDKEPQVNEKGLEAEPETDTAASSSESEDEPNKDKSCKKGRGKMGCRGKGHRRGFGGRGGRGGMGRRGGFGPHGMMFHGHPHGHFGPHGMGPFGPQGMRPHFGPHGMGPHSFGPHPHPFAHGRGGPFGGMRGGCRRGFGQRWRTNMEQTPFDVSDLNEALQGEPSSANENTEKCPKARSCKKGAGLKKNKKEKEADFRPLADVFNTSDSFVVHVGLPGAKQEDIKLAWRPKRGILVISGTVARPVDEVLLQNLKRSERKVGKFHRRVRLGRPAHPPQVDAERISAELESGILRVVVPKKKQQEQQMQEYVEVEKDL